MSDSPDPPDYGPLAQASKAGAIRAYKLSKQQFGWSKKVWHKQQQLLKKVLGPQLDIMKEQYKNAKHDRARYEKLYQPLEENLIKEFQQYDSPARQNMMAGRAMSSVAQAQKAARQNAQSRLEGYGIDPSQTRSAALDRNMLATEAAQKAAAGTVERHNVENTGRALRAEALNIGRGYPSNVAGAYGQSVTAGNSAVGNMNNTASVGGQLQGTGLQWGAQGMQGMQTASNIQSQGYQNELAQGSPMDFLGQAFGQWAGTGFQKPWGGAAGGLTEAINDRPAPRDTVPAQLPSGEALALQPGEYIVPKVVKEYYGTKYLDGLKTKALEAMGISEDDLGSAREDRAQFPVHSREVRPSPKA